MGRVVSKSGQISKSQSLISCALERQRDAYGEIAALDAFVKDTSLSGEAYCNAKGYVQSILIPINKMLCVVLDDEILANKTVIRCCDSHLAGVDKLVEDDLREEINRLEKEIRELQDDWWELLPVIRTINKMRIDYNFSQIFFLEEQINKLDAYDQSTQGLHDNANTQMNILAEKCSSIFASSLFSRNRFNYSGINMDWTIDAVRRWDDHKALKDGYIHSFYIHLPDGFRDHLSPDDFMVTDDGFVICTKPMDSIMTEMNMSDCIIGSDSFKVSNYDDWYLGGIVGKDGIVTYTLIKMREPGDAQGRTGSAVPFIALDMEHCSAALEKISGRRGKTEDLQTVCSEIYKVTNAAGTENAVLRDYFANPKSDGSYLIADCIVEKVVKSNFDKNNVWKLPAGYDENDEYARAYLDELSQKGVYDKENNSIRINDKENLTQDEYNAVLTATTGNIDAYSYAAENQYHAELQQTADALQATLYNYNPNDFGGSVIAGNIIEKHSIISDAGVGESRWGVIYENKFKDPDSKLYKEQKRWH